jgi:hypothetical protein
VGAHHLGAPGNFHGRWGGNGHRYARLHGYYGYYGGGPYEECASPYALINPYYCQYPYSY